MAETIDFQPVNFFDSHAKKLWSLHDSKYADHVVAYEHNHDLGGKILMVMVVDGKVIHTHTHDGQCKILVASTPTVEATQTK
jgi:hypothetical protein